MSDDETEKTFLRLAAENDQKAIDRALAKQKIDGPLGALAANIIRVARGAGSPAEILENCVDLIKCFREYRDALGTWPDSYEIQEALSIHNEDLERLTGENVERQYAVEMVIRGALQVAASRLLGQRPQESRGESEMYDGINTIHRMRVEEDRIWREAHRELTAPKRGKKQKQPPGL